MSVLTGARDTTPSLAQMGPARGLGVGASIRPDYHDRWGAHRDEARAAAGAAGDEWESHGLALDHGSPSGGSAGPVSFPDSTSVLR